MIDNAKLNEMIAAEMGVIELMLGQTQALIDICDEHGPGLDELQARQDRIVGRVEAFPAAVLAHGPFLTMAAARAAMEMEVRFVVAAIDGPN
jgi:hypothetical protein